MDRSWLTRGGKMPMPNTPQGSVSRLKAVTAATSTAAATSAPATKRPQRIRVPSGAAGRRTSASAAEACSGSAG